jgi:hypothetical protein
MKTFDQFAPSKLIGLSGTLSAGKDTAATYLVDCHGFMHVSTGDVIRAECRKLGLDTLRATLVEKGKELRAEGGPGALITKGMEMWTEQRDRFAGGLVISGLRAVSEASTVPEEGGTLTFVDGPVTRRFEESNKRARDDAIFPTIEDFQEYERLEFEGLLGDDGPNLRAVRDMANIRLWNEMSNIPAYLYDLEIALGIAAWAVGE